MLDDIFALHTLIHLPIFGGRARTQPEERRLSGLLRRLAPQGIGAQMSPPSAQVTTLVTGSGSVYPVSIEAISLAGFCVAVGVLVKAEESVLVRAAADGVDYVFPCQVLWVDKSRVGLALIALPRMEAAVEHRRLAVAAGS